MDPNSLNEAALALDSPAPAETPESSSQEQAPLAPEEAQEASPDAEDAEAQGAEGETQEETEEDEEAAPEAPKPGGHKRNGYKAKLQRLEREKAQLLEMLQRGVPQQQPQAAQPELTEQEKAVEQLRAFARQEFQREYQREAQARQQQQQHADLQKQMEEARSKHADFDDTLEDVAHIAVPAHVHEAILKSERKAEIMYALAKNQGTELARVTALPPLDAALAIGRLEAKLASGPTQQTTPKPTARPPAPPSKVNGGSTPSTRRWDDIPLSEHKRAHNRSK